jgi:HAD superfamily hydrolase (TIGR01549 family)
MDRRPFEPPPKAIFFDLDDTLCDYASARLARLRIAFSLDAKGRPRERPEQQLDQMIADSIRMHPHGVDHFEKLFAKYGIGEMGEAKAAANWYRQNRFHELRLFPEARKILTSVRTVAHVAGATSRRPIGVITNGPTEIQKAKIDLLGIAECVDFVIISEEFGAAKPDASIFEAALELSGVEAAAAVFVGDSLEMDVAGAHAAGIRSIWVNALGVPSNEDGCAPDRQVRSVAEVPGLVGSMLTG